MPAESEADIFAALGRPLVAKTLAGEVGVIFAYGQTGSGKTMAFALPLLQRLQQAAFAAVRRDHGRGLAGNWADAGASAADEH